jgi:diguanylate cyclase (GGDEF)-like protein
MPDADFEQAHRQAERFRERIMGLDTRRWHVDRQITVSIGLTLSRRSGDTPSTMLQRADSALYDAKRAGRNCVKWQIPVPESPAPGPVAPGRVEYA